MEEQNNFDRDGIVSAITDNGELLNWKSPSSETEAVFRYPPSDKKIDWKTTGMKRTPAHPAKIEKAQPDEVPA